MGEILIIQLIIYEFTTYKLLYCRVESQLSISRRGANCKIELNFRFDNL